jgi:hypothetical protein
MSVGTMLRNSWLMPRSTHISVYVVRAVSCRWRTRETYFPTIPYTNKVDLKLNFSPA